MKTECEAVFLFIAELTGSFTAGSGNKERKIECGQKDYIRGITHELDLSCEEDRKDLHENIWLERLYADLDAYFGIIPGDKTARYLAIDIGNYRSETFRWTVAIECDASASMLQYMGILLGDKRLMNMTNVIGDTLEDPWKLEGMPRKMLKTAATPMLYGSAKACHELWQSAKIPYTMDDITLYKKELGTGPLGLANMLKEFIINNANPKAKMEVKIGDDEFSIECNRFRNVGERTKAYKIWDSIDEQYNIVLHTDTKKVPDLDQFRRYFVTLLVHNLDSQVADNVSYKVKEKHGWTIPIHDAFLISPAAAADTRKWYAEELQTIFANRKQILAGYFKSIGITSAAKEQWDKLMERVDKFEGDLVVNPMALK